MRLTIIGIFLTLGLSLLMVGASASASTNAVHGAANLGVCTKAAQGHSRVTKSVIASCRPFSVDAHAHCPKGSGPVIFPDSVTVRVNGQFYDLTTGRKPHRLSGDLNTFIPFCFPHRSS
jgi:hypothetical protein